MGRTVPFVNVSGDLTQKRALLGRIPLSFGLEKFPVTIDDRDDNAEASRSLADESRFAASDVNGVQILKTRSLWELGWRGRRAPRLIRSSGSGRHHARYH